MDAVQEAPPTAHIVDVGAGRPVPHRWTEPDLDAMVKAAGIDVRAGVAGNSSAARSADSCELTAPVRLRWVDDPLVKR